MRVSQAVGIQRIIDVAHAAGNVLPTTAVWSVVGGGGRAARSLNALCPERRVGTGFNFLPLQLNTRSAGIKSLRDLTDKDKIALPAVKVSMQAIILQMAAAQTFGEANYAKLDALGNGRRVNFCDWSADEAWVVTDVIEADRLRAGEYR